MDVIVVNVGNKAVADGLFIGLGEFLGKAFILTSFVDDGRIVIGDV